MSASNSMEDALLGLILNNTNFANVGDATGLRGSTTAGSLFVSLHSADPGEAGDQTTNEIAYTSYARVAVTRAGTGWTITGGGAGTATNAGAVTFPTCTGGSATATHAAIGTATSGAGVRLLSGALAQSISISTSVNPTPNFPIGSLVVSLD